MDPTDEDQLLSSKFETRDQLLTCVRNFYSKKGFALSILRSTSEKYVVLRCDRGGHYRNTHKIPEDQRKKDAGSRLINCPFQLYGKKNKDDVWIVELRNNTHNHVASTDMSGHPSSRRLTNGQKKTVENMSNSGVPPRQILSSLRQENPSMQAISRTIYNAKTKIKNCRLNGKTMIQALFDELGQGGFMYNILRDEVGHITPLFFVDPRSIMLTKSFTNVFIMDCTYKTNKYKMPLLDIIGVTCFNTSFYSGFVFLKKECTENYVWSLEMFKNILGQGNQPSVIMTDRELALINAISIVFPSATHMLCVWHINKNILGKCKKFFKSDEGWDKFMADWKVVVYSTTGDEYDGNWQEFESTYGEKKVALKYIKDTWLPMKQKFVSAWTDNHLHLRNRVSSRAEGAHAKLKQYLQVSTGDLQIVRKKICLAVENEFHEIRVQLAREKLQELHKQYEMAKKGTMHSICTGQFMATMGMPCAHQMENWKTGSLSLDQVHPQWRIDIRELIGPDANSTADPDDQMKTLLDGLYKEYLKWPLDKKKLVMEKVQELANQSDVLFEPTIMSKENRFQAAKKRKAISSTRRDPSLFEVAEDLWQSSSSREVCHSKQPHPAFEIPATIADNDVFGWIDSNM